MKQVNASRAVGEPLFRFANIRSSNEAFHINPPPKDVNVLFTIPEEVRKGLTMDTVPYFSSLTLRSLSD